MKGAVMEVSMNCFLSDDPTRSPVDEFVNELALLRDEGFRRVWAPQMPYEADLLTVLAVAFREVDTIEVGTGVLPIQNQHPMLLAQRAMTISLISGGSVHARDRHDPPHGHRGHVGDFVGQARAPTQRIPRRPASVAVRTGSQYDW